MISRCIVVLSLPRSGSSCVAGALHSMGVDLGDGHLQPADGNNPRGYYEDLRWQALNKQITGPRYGTNDPAVISARQQAEYRALAQACATRRLWGMKDPRLCFTFTWVREALIEADVDIRVVAVYRHPDAVAASLRRHSERSYKGQYRMDEAAARALHDTWARAMTARLQGWPGPVLSVAYEQLLANAAGEVGRLADFAFGGTRWQPALREGIRFVDAGLNHHGA